jgi:outer membrane receptor protein involved in Fe transport
MSESRFIGRRVLALLLATTSTAAWAQDGATPKDPATTPPIAGAHKDSLAAKNSLSPSEEIVVTGSRIRRRSTDSPAPVAVLTSEQIRQAGQPEIADVVNQLPALAVTQTNQTSNLKGNAGINALDLRGLGTQRTLVLVDGRRHVPAIPGTSAVDVSTIPSSLVERVEILTGGASALYGADAVAGVANFILKKNYEGIEGDYRYGNSNYHDLPSYDVSLLAGKNFAEGRGNITLYGFWEKQAGLSGRQRPWTAQPYPVYSRPNTNSIYTIQDGVYNIAAADKAQVLLGGKLYSFTSTGQLRTPVLGPGGIVNRGPEDLNDPTVLGDLLTDGGEYDGRYDDWYLQVPTRRASVHGSTDYAFSDALKLFFTGDFSRIKSRSNGAPQSSFGGDVVPGDSPFITQQMRDAAGSDLADGINYARKFVQLGVPYTDYTRKSLELIGGLEGKFSLFSQPWNYSAYYSYGKSTQRRQDVNNTAYGRYLDALDSTTGPNGQPICRSTLTDPGNGCVPLNPFMDLTQDEINYLQYTSSPGRSRLTQQVASAYVSGGLFKLPGGAAQLVLGAEYRRESQFVGAIPQYDPSSPLFDPSTQTTQMPLSGKYSVKEAFSEVHLPILANRPFFHTLSLDAAVRLSDYSTAGRTTTWKFGGEWAPVRDIRFRSTYGQAVRAPNIGELYTQSSIGGVWLNDPCNTYNLANRVGNTQYTAANCAQINPSDKTTYWHYLNVITQGNINLKPEVARTLTIGAVIQPHWIRNLSITVDYYDINIKGAIATFDPQTIIYHCVDAATMDNQYCPFVQRDANNNILTVTTENLNLSGYHTKGIDMELVYQLPLADIGLGPNSGTLSIDSAYTRLLIRDYQLDPTDPTTITHTAGIFGTPKWKGVTRTSWSNDTLSLTWTLRHYGPMQPTTTTTSDLYSPNKTPNVFYNDFSVSYHVNKMFELYGGVENAFNRAPPRIPGAEAGGANFETGYTAGTYDVIGRTFWVGLRLSHK